MSSIFTGASRISLISLGNAWVDSPKVDLVQSEKSWAGSNPVGEVSFAEVESNALSLSTLSRYVPSVPWVE
ncbi:9226_t:CDS:2 [Acaulospora colombiana]|uniref:9226_t:CDS:1 n=1 Tax=Acaulospora colombiana TaxID=27376 RepID=A0ACA9MA00_9GLOM|nr:9226_t:CDS:2 [Acaulospora colombiana]